MLVAGAWAESAVIQLPGVVLGELLGHVAQCGGFAALGFDAANLVMQAVKEAGSAAPAKVLAAMGTIRTYDGISGTLRFAHGSHVPKKDVTIILIEDGKEKLVEQLVPDDVPPP